MHRQPGLVTFSSVWLLLLSRLGGSVIMYLARHAPSHCSAVPTMRFRHSASFGKRQEFGAIAELLRRGYDVYVTLVDDQGIDCIVRQGPRRYFDIQVKARSAEATARNSGFFPQLKITNPRRNYVFVLYAEGIGERGTYWVIPSTYFARRGFALTIKSGPRKGQHRIKLNNGSRARPKYAKYIDAWEAALGKPPKPRPEIASADASRRKALRNQSDSEALAGISAARGRI